MEWPRNIKQRFFVAAGLFVISAATSNAAVDQSQLDREFTPRVYPLLKEKCFACHGDDPEKINTDPYGEGWIVKVAPSGDIDESAMLNPDAYQALLDEEEA